MAKWLLIDGYNLMFRSFYGMPDLIRSDGFPTNAIHGWVRTLWRLVDDESPDYMVVFFDLGGDKRREALQPEYKANREACPEPLSLQIPFIKEITLAMGYGGIEKEGVEADDLIGVYARELAKNGEEVLIVSADKDLAQCVTDGVTQLLPPPTANPKLGWRRLNAEGVKRKFGVRPDQIPDYLALIGDTSDNIPGLRGVGPKTAAKWLNGYGNLERVIENCGKLKPQRFQSQVYEKADALRCNLLMTTLQYDHESHVSSKFTPDREKLLALLSELEMKTAHRDASERYAE
jgi:DNA polymerase-1